MHTDSCSLTSYIILLHLLRILYSRWWKTASESAGFFHRMAVATTKILRPFYSRQCTDDFWFILLHNYTSLIVSLFTTGWSLSYTMKWMCIWITCEEGWKCSWQDGLLVTLWSGCASGQLVKVVIAHHRVVYLVFWNIVYNYEIFVAYGTMELVKQLIIIYLFQWIHEMFLDFRLY